MTTRGWTIEDHGLQLFEGKEYWVTRYVNGDSEFFIRLERDNPAHIREEMQIGNLMDGAAQTALRIGEKREQRLDHDLLAYAGALGYPIPGDHNGLLTSGEQPKCGLCDAKEKLLVRVEAERDRADRSAKGWMETARLADENAENCRKASAALRTELGDLRAYCMGMLIHSGAAVREGQDIVRQFDEVIERIETRRKG